MTNPKTDTEIQEDENPAPILGSWNRVYMWLLILNFLFAVLFYLFMIHYS